MGRAERRRERAKKFKRIMKVVEWLRGHKTPQKYIDNLCVCSRFCCGNPRKFEGSTLQEKKHERTLS